MKVEGRQTKRTLAWELFKDTISELEKKENSFRTIIVDLLEDLYEHCRLYMYQQMGITHESDDSFRAWDKVRGEFLNTLKRLMNLDYENIILISHEDTSKDITRKGGDKITAIKPNLQEKVANKVAGMVDVVARIVADGDARTFSFKSNEVIFGGGRLKVNAKDIPLDVDALFAVYDEANKNAASGAAVTPAATTPAKAGRTGRKRTETPATPADKPQDSPKEEQAVNDTPEKETPQEAPKTAAEQQPEKEAGTWTPGGGETDDSIPAEETPVEGAMNPPEAPAEEEKPRRKRKAREQRKGQVQTMNNPFGIPDELMNAVISAAFKQQQEMKKGYKPENPFNIDPAAAAKKSASTAKQLYDAYVEAGFTQEQAFELVKGILTTKRN